MDRGQPLHGPLEVVHYGAAKWFVEQRSHYLTMTLERDGSVWVQVWEVDDFGPARVWPYAQPGGPPHRVHRCCNH